TYALQQNTSLFDHLIGASDERRRDVKVQSFGGLEVDDQLELDRSLNWKVGGVGALEKTINIASRSFVEVVRVPAVGHHGTGNGGVAECKQYRHRVLPSQFDDELVIHDCDGVRHGDQAAILFTGKRDHGVLDLSRVVHACHFQLHPKTWRRGFGCPPKRHIRSRLRVKQGENASSPRADLLEQLQPLAPHRGFEIGESRGIAAWPRQTLDEAAADRIGNLHENDRDRAGYLLKRGEPRIALNQNDVWHQADQLCRVGSKALDVAGDGAILDVDVTTFCPPKLSQFLHERWYRFWTGLRGTQEHANPPRPL